MPNIIQSSLLSSLPGISHGVTSRVQGDARNLQSILRALDISYDWYVGAEQVHGSVVLQANDHIIKRIMLDADGLITNKIGRILGILSADCAPLLFADIDARVVGAIHAGWRGIISRIIYHAVQAMTEAGANTNTMMVFIGPHIGACCYTVDSNRADHFSNRYLENGVWHVDIGAEALAQLLDSGIPREHIDAPVTCTSCQNDVYFSFRKDSQETFGKMLSYISLV